MQTVSIDVAGLAARSEITIDRYGIAHLKAGSLPDLFFLQGFNAARDRLWQIDLWRKRGLGILAADFGPGYLAQDRATRLFLYRGDMSAEWAAYGDDAEEICTRFVEGINAYIDGVMNGAHPSPTEFQLMGTRPEKWHAEDVVRIRSHAMMRNAVSEVIRARVMSVGAADLDLFRQKLEPPKAPHVAEGLDLASIPLEVTDVFKLAAASVGFDDMRLAAPLSEAAAWSKVTAAGDVVRADAPQAAGGIVNEGALDGSNNWVVHGSRSASGRPILANDPHRAHGAPSLRYLVHLTAPGLDVIGAGEPCLPGISLGHNGTSAFGLTLFFGPDQEDVYVYETSPIDPHLYRYGDGWERMRIVEEQVSIKGAEEQTITLKFTRHGPVVYEDPARSRAYSIRSVWFEPGAAPYFASIQTMRARTLDDFRAGMARWSVPATNQVYADTTGTIAWLPAAFSPIRPNWDGLLPVPGDGRYEWAGFYTAADLPIVVDPPEGYFATANQYNLPPDWPHAEKQIGYEWVEPSRMHRIVEALSASASHSLADSCALQTDVLSLPARRLTALAAGLTEHEAIAEARALFAGWDHRLTVDSAAAALFEVWWSVHLRPGVIERIVPDASLGTLLLPGDIASVLALMEAPDARLGHDPVAGRDARLAQTLADAWSDCRKLMGPDPAGWRWGDLHRGYFTHALSSTHGSGETPLDVGPIETGGSESTPMNARYRTSDFRVTNGASVRLVIDVGDWDKSLCINAPGQSGDPHSAHYADLAGRWAEGDYVPLLYSDDAIAKAAESRLVLIPAG